MRHSKQSRAYKTFKMLFNTLTMSDSEIFVLFLKLFFERDFLQINCTILKKTLELIELYVIIYISNVIFAL